MHDTLKHPIQRRRAEPTNAFIRFAKASIDQSLPERFQQQVQLHPENLAIKTSDHRLTYKTLNQLANRIARAILNARGLGEEPIVLFFESGAPIIAAMLGVLKTGKFYVPLDASVPPERLRAILGDVQTRLILTDSQQIALVQTYFEDSLQILNIDDLPSDLSTDDLNLSIPPDALAYILYTSGSTGQPKGVTQHHQYVLNLTRVYTNSSYMCAKDRFALLYSPSFAGAVRDIYCALLNGAAVFPLDVKRTGLSQLANWLIQEEITIFFAVATMFRHFAQLLTGREPFSKLRLIQIGSETVYKKDVELYKRHFAEHCMMVANLGGSEMSPVRQYFIDHDTDMLGSTVPAGYAVEDTEVLLWNDAGRPVGDNEVGEIVVKSRYLSPGYWRRPDLTQAAFLPDPDCTGVRLYKTGDLGRMLPDGCLLHLGRKDFQMKIRGYRVEVAEVEMALLNTGLVGEAAVVAAADHTGEQQLVAYIVPIASGQMPSIGELRSLLTKSLPDYMIPSHFVSIEAMPLTSTGKLDRRALPDFSQVQPESLAPFVAPCTPVEQRVGEVWAQALGVEHIGIHDNFFELGGHSILATQITARLLDLFSVQLSSQTLFDAPTIAELAERIETAEWANTASPMHAPDHLDDYEEGRL